VYLPSVGFVVAVAIAITAASGANATNRGVRVAFLLSILLLFSGMTMARVRVWRDDVTFWRDVAAKSPAAGVAHAGLGHALFVGGDVDGAVIEYELAIGLKPDHADSHLNLGVALAGQGRHEAALRHYAEALRLQPNRAVAHANLAISLSALGHRDDALSEARRAVELQPDDAIGHHALGVALGNAGRVADAAYEFRRAIELDPTDAGSRANLERAEGLLQQKMP
jgi:Flp pilus assembly protein TadD